MFEFFHPSYDILARSRQSAMEAEQHRDFAAFVGKNKPTKNFGHKRENKKPKSFRPCIRSAL
jgi:hypothetical protein